MSESSTETVTQVRVANLCCALEADLVSDVLRPLPGVKRVTVNTVTKVATVEHDSELISPVEICNILNTKLLGASLIHTGLEEGDSQASALLEMRRKAGIEAVFILLQLIAIVWGALVPLIIAFLLSFSLFISFVRALMMKRFSDVSVLMLLAAVGAAIEMQWTEAVLVGAIVNLSGLIQSCMGIRVTKSLEDIAATTESPTATLAGTRKLVEVENLKVGDRILVRTGDSIPVDGKVIDGNASVDESRLTGESVPVYKSKGSDVYSGTLVVKGALPCVEVTSPIGRTQKVTDLIQEAAAQRTPLQDTVDKFAKYYTPLVVIISLAIGICYWSLERGLIVLVAACPCSIVMAAPVAYMSAIVTGVRRYYGTVLKSPAIIEVLAKIELVAFDKTGTLTQGEHHVRSVKVYPTAANLKQKDILRLAAAVESLSPHPLASSVVNYYTGCAASYVERGPSSLPPVENFRTVGDNLGVAGTVEGKEVTIGGPAMLKYMGADMKEITEGSASVLFVLINENVVLRLELEDRIRPGASEALKNLTKPTMMLTGDRAAVARDVAAEIGVDDYKADLRPGDKLDFIRDYQSSDPKTLPLTHPKMGSSVEHPVMMVGDGLNDGPALALAAVGVSFASPCKAVSEKAADIIITDPNRGLFLLRDVMVLGSRVRSIVRENLALALCTKAIVVAVGAAGYIPLWASVLSDGICLLIVMVNGARPLDWKPNNAAMMDKFAYEATQVRTSAVSFPAEELSSTQCKKSCCQKVSNKTCCEGSSKGACGGASKTTSNCGSVSSLNEARSWSPSKCCGASNIPVDQQQTSKCCDEGLEASSVGPASCLSKECCNSRLN